MSVFSLLLTYKTFLEANKHTFIYYFCFAIEVVFAIKIEKLWGYLAFLKLPDMLLAIEDDLLSFRMNAHVRIARLAYQQGLCGAITLYAAI